MRATQASLMDLIIRQKELNVFETANAQVDSFLTPSELFYVRSHSSVRLVPTGRGKYR
jgi:hypothetical protein